MTKRHMIRPVRRSSESDTCSGAVWAGVGRQLHRRRTELGVGVSYVASRVGISADSYEGYEAGFRVPAASLAQIADLFDVPVVWFFRDVAHQATHEESAAPGEPAASEPVVYTVATVEHRTQALVDSFRKLDLEGQQHLLAISKALTRASAEAVRD